MDDEQMFIRKSSETFTNARAKENRVRSADASVISIEALDIRRVHIYFDVYGSSFSQISSK
ncbi:hypothetical protein MBANPS3_011154 [Mucor bainieri]